MERTKGRVYLFCAFTLAGTSVIAARVLAGRLGTFTTAAVSLFIALLVLVPAGFKHLKRQVRQMAPRAWAAAGLQALFGVFLFRMFILLGLRLTDAGEAGIVTGATPAVTAILACFFLKERVGSLGMLGICSTVAGVLVLQGLFSGIAPVPEHILGNVLVLCAAASESAFNVLSRANVLREGKRGSEAPAPVAHSAVVCAAALVLCIPFAAFEDPAASLRTLPAEGWLALGWYGVFATALAYVCWYSGIRRCPAYTAAAFSGMMPFTALVLSVLLLGEQSGLAQWSGALFVAAGMAAVGRASAPGKASSFSESKWGKLWKKRRSFGDANRMEGRDQLRSAERAGENGGRDAPGKRGVPSAAQDLQHPRQPEEVL